MMMIVHLHNSNMITPHANEAVKQGIVFISIRVCVFVCMHNNWKAWIWSYSYFIKCEFGLPKLCAPLAQCVIRFLCQLHLHVVHK